LPLLGLNSFLDFKCCKKPAPHLESSLAYTPHIDITATPKRHPQDVRLKQKTSPKVHRVLEFELISIEIPEKQGVWKNKNEAENPPRF
jgi:hypothetical protein